MKQYILSVDQSTQGTKGLLFDENGRLIKRADRPHRQIINDRGWVSHDPDEILRSTIGVCADVIRRAGVSPEDVKAFGISNQRETSLMWNRETGEPIADAIVWQCARASEICARHAAAGESERIRQKTGIPLSPYYPASKLQWLMENVPAARALAAEGRLAAGTIDTWLVFHLTTDHVMKTDFSNAARTQLFNIHTLKWDEDLCKSFGIPMNALGEVTMSDAVYGVTDLGGLLKEPIPVCGVLGDSNGALFGQNCRQPGDIKSTYGTGSSVMMNTGRKPVLCESGLAASIAWGANNTIEYVLEGNLNYTGAVISWLKDDMRMIASADETEEIARSANPNDRTYFVPAFTGLGAPYWDSAATGLFTGITRTTGAKEMVRSCVECIAYQINDLIGLMRHASGYDIPRLHADGGPTANTYLMQFQADVSDVQVVVPCLQELSGMGAAYMAGITAGIYDPERIYGHIAHTSYEPRMDAAQRNEKRSGWAQAVRQTLAHS